MASRADDPARLTVGRRAADDRDTSVASAPRVLDAAALLSEVADEVVERTVRGHPRRVVRARAPRSQASLRTESRLPELVHRGVAAGAYAGLGAGFRALSAGLGALADLEVGPALEDSEQGRAVHAAVNGIIGDRLARERPRLAVPLAVPLAQRSPAPL